MSIVEKLSIKYGFNLRDAKLFLKHGGLDIRVHVIDENTFTAVAHLSVKYGFDIYEATQFLNSG